MYDIHDSYIYIYKTCTFLSLVRKADVLVPPGLLIKNSTIPNAGRGVFANCEIPKHEFFGPYLGKIIAAKDAKNYKHSRYVWEVSFSL